MPMPTLQRLKTAMKIRPFFFISFLLTAVFLYAAEYIYRLVLVDQFIDQLEYCRLKLFSQNHDHPVVC